jgi:hypothetical protein
MNKKICITSTRSVGCTFIDWSIHFLSGQNDFYNTTTGSWLPLTTDPVTTSNSHGHLKNHPSGQKKCKEFLDTADSLATDRFYSAYPVHLHPDIAAAELGIDINNIDKEFVTIFDYVANDYNQLLETCYKQNAKVIFVATNTTIPFYFLTIRSLDRWLFKPGHIDSANAAIDEMQHAFFKDSIRTWNDLGLRNVWDVRERRALDLRVSADADKAVTNLAVPHLWIDCVDFWTRGDALMQTIMDYVELKIITNRFESWGAVFKKWQKIQLDALQFDYNCNHIVDAIINNWYYEINLTFEQEIVIQHFLIYKHNLNLKTWALEKFPNNTQDLHKLLEPNFHPIDKVY